GIAVGAGRRLVTFAGTRKAGDPRDLDTKVRPLISEQSAIRAESWLRDAEQGRAKLLCGRHRERSVITPAIVTQAPQGGNVWCQEAFAPLLALQPFDDFEAAIEDANSTPFGLSAGAF